MTVSQLGNQHRRIVLSQINSMKAGKKVSRCIVGAIMPPTVGAAIGFITSELMPVSQRIGARVRMTAVATMSFGSVAALRTQGLPQEDIALPSAVPSPCASGMPRRVSTPVKRASSGHLRSRKSIPKGVVTRNMEHPCVRTVSSLMVFQPEANTFRS